MNILLSICVILLGILYIGTRQKGDSRLLTLMVLLLLVLTMCYIRYWINSDSFMGNNVGYDLAPLNYVMGKGGCKGDLNESDIVFPSPAPMAWDGLDIKSSPKPTYKLISDVTIFSPVGDGIKLTEDIDAYRFNTVDGKPNSPRHLFMLAHNQSRPECCPSTFSDSRGCVCLTKEQEEMINKRMGNRTTDTYPNI